jgi:hypothetical protein
LLALCDLFGLYRLEQPTTNAVPWTPQGIYQTAFGDAFFTVMDNLDIMEFIRDDVPAFGAWQKIFAPYFPAWRENLVLPKPECREGVFVFKASLGVVWRRIAIPGALTLAELAHAILSAFDFKSDHLFDFRFRDATGRTVCIRHPDVEEGPWTDEFAIGELPLKPSESMTFHFDYGDNWKFNVKLEKMEPYNPRLRNPELRAKHGEAPEQYPDADW